MPDDGERNGGSLQMEDNGEYRQRVRSLERQQDAFATSLASLHSKIDEKFGILSTSMAQQSRPQWNNIIAACAFTFMLVSGLVSLITVPIFSSIGDIKGVIGGEIKDTIQRTRSELADAIVRGRGERDSMLKDLRSELSLQIKEIREVLIPREENRERWAGQARHDDDTQRQLNQLYENQQGIYNARDVIQQLLRDVGDLKRSPEKN